MTPKQQLISVLRVFLRDFNGEISCYNIVDWSAFGALNIEWFCTNKKAVSFIDDMSSVGQAYTVISNKGLKIAKDCKNEIIEEFKKYPHIKNLNEKAFVELIA